MVTNTTFLITLSNIMNATQIINNKIVGNKKYFKSNMIQCANQFGISADRMKYLVFDNIEEGKNKTISVTYPWYRIGLVSVVYDGIEARGETNDILKQYYSYKITNEEVDAINRIIIGVLGGFEISFYYINGEWKKIIRNPFNTYILEIIQCLKTTGKLQVDLDRFENYFFQQMAQTDINIQSIRLIEYNKGLRNGKSVWGLKLKNKEIFISDVIEFYLDNKEIYRIAREQITELELEEYQQIVTVILMIFKCLECVE